VDRANVDTDALIPKQFMKSISRTGFGDNLFDEWRYLDRGELGQDVSQRPRNPAFSLNQARYEGAQILLARENFGCGSSREHAVWALNDFGIRVLLAPSFADIFFNNCFKNGLLPIVLPNALIEQLFNEVEYNPGYTLTVDLSSQAIRSSTGMSISFDIDATRKHRLLEGLDDIGITLQNAELIRAYEARQRLASLWLFN
jgi:3-isopropylmalate/(R)-2-methylmalate dehydratase small subunit